MAIFDEYLLVSSRVRMSNTPKMSITFVTFTHLERVLILQDLRHRMMPCTMFGCPSKLPGRSVVSANNLDGEVKGHGKFEHRQGSFGRVFNPWPVGICEI